MFSEAELRQMYAALGEPVAPVAGAAFSGILSIADVDPISGPSIVGDYELRYPLASATLNPGDVLTIGGRQYRVADDPYRIGDGLEAVVRLRVTG